MRSFEIRERFLRFFEERGHHRLPSASLIPHDDASLLFTVAGMVPLKPFISGRRTPPAPNLTSCQKCFRGSGVTYDDIANVGDSSHHTFFEMLGNWSIGDYFKEGAIDYAWELATGVFGLDPQRIWASVYPDDTVAAGIWEQRIGLPRERIVAVSGNWWAAGPTGPCGYDSEMHWDFGPPCSCGRSDCRPDDECGGDRWLEFWNLVFMEFDQQSDGSRPLLPKPTVDTGMSLERITAVVQGVRSNYETDLFLPLVAGFRARAAHAEASPQSTRSMNVLADHLRGASFLIADGVYPSNEGRGYVLRRVIRRAAVHGRRVGLRGGLAAGVGDLVAVMGEAYPELVEQRGLVEGLMRDEESTFERTLEGGSQRLEEVLSRAGGSISGADAFRLYDTFGLPIELTVEMAAERGAVVDLEGFRGAMEQQRAQSRSRDARVSAGFGDESGIEASRRAATNFVGYDRLEADAEVLALAPARDALGAGEEGRVIIDVSPFYAEAGGQVGDTGTLTWEGGSARVVDTQLEAGARVHAVHVDEGALRSGTRVRALVDAQRRARLARHHSATHLLNRALREVLGDAIVQRGSLVAPEHTTFDFSFPRALTAAELADIEHRVNDAIRRNLERTAAEMPLSAARASGAIALLDERYADLVRVIDFGGWSRELCGGTHVARSGDLGAAIIVSESSIGQGVRRIDLVAGEAAEQRWRQTAAALQSTARELKARPEEVPQRVAALQEQVRRLSRDVEEARRHGGGESLAAATVEEIGDLRLAVAVLDSETAGDGAVAAADRLYSERLGGDGVAVALGRESLVVKVGGRALERGVSAGDLVRDAAQLMGGRGGGRAEFARGAVKDASKRDAAVDSIRRSVARAAGV